MQKHIGRTDRQLLDRLQQEPNIPAASTFHDRATAEFAVSNVLDENKTQIDNFLSGQNNQIVIIQGVDPVGTSFKRNTTTAAPGIEIYLIIRRDESMHNGYRIHTGFPNP